MSWLGALQWPAMIVTVVGVAGGITAKVQAQLGLLDVSAEQRSLDRMGSARRRLRFDRASALPRISKYSWSDQEPYRLNAPVSTWHSHPRVGYYWRFNYFQFALKRESNGSANF